MYFKDTLKDGITIVRNHFDTLIWIKLDATFFRFDKDVYICGAYLWGENSPAYNVVNVDLYDVLESDIDFFEGLGSVYTMGDLNSRIGMKSDTIVHDNVNCFTDFVDYIPDVPLTRASMDKICNNYGSKLLDLCKSTCLRILNGRLGTDYDVGEFTYVSPNGASVIDYVLTKECNFGNICKFDIGTLNEWSDHTPVSFSLTCNVITYETTQHDEIKYRWNSDSRDTFRSGLIGNLPYFNQLTSDIDLEHRSSINNVINNFTDTIRRVADPLFIKCSTYTTKSSFLDKSLINNKEWFDVECTIARNCYLQALRVFNKSKNDANREYFCTCKKKYKDLCRRTRRRYELKKISDIEQLRFSKPKQFWKYFKKRSTNTGNGVPLNDFLNYFSTLGGDNLNCIHDEAESFCNAHNFNDNMANGCEELDVPITVTEIVFAIKALKAGKAAGSDFLINEYFIESIDILGSHLCDIFNAILSTGYFPDKWTEGVIIPIYKKGDKRNPSNYRGITLVSCLSKLFTSILNKRIEVFCSNNNTISDSQFGFRKGRSTVDAIFILQSIIQQYLNSNSRLYVLYVDLKRCFDTIYRNALWLKLYKSGIKGKVLRIIKDMYEKVKSCVKHCNTFSEYFEYAVGLRQGEVMSPLLFSLFIEDLELHLQNNIDSGLQIDDIVLILLLFADDMAILGKSPQDLQNSIDLLHTFCTNWGLEVNIDKTKIMVFRKRGRLLENEKWTFNGNPLEVVNNFNYLGIVFNYTGNFSMNQDYITGKALKALNVLWLNCIKVKMKPKILCQVFDAFVGSTLSYGSEVWGFSKYTGIERIHLKFCKRLLNVRCSTSTFGVYGELGRYPLYVTRYIRIIKYWCKLIITDNIILQTVYNQALSDCKRGRTNWVASVKKLLCDYGFAYVFDEQRVDNISFFIGVFRQRIIDSFIQQWYGSLDTSPILKSYKLFKLQFQYEIYLDVLPSNLRFYISRLRLSAHSLRIQTGRYARNRIPRNERYCTYCNTNDIEDEYHFVCVCPCYINIRQTYLKPYYYRRPSVYKYLELLKTSNKKILFKLANYMKNALYYRNSLTTV